MYFCSVGTGGVEEGAVNYEYGHRQQKNEHQLLCMLNEDEVLKLVCA